jgi:flagellar biosynthesis/type III secretory pathway protein FliH
MGNEMLPKEWVEELCTRLARALDAEPEEVECDGDCGAWSRGHEEGYEEGQEDADEARYKAGFEEGFAAGVAHANEFPKDK